MSQLKFSFKIWNKISIGGARASWTHSLAMPLLMYVTSATVIFEITFIYFVLFYPYLTWKRRFIINQVL